MCNQLTLHHELRIDIGRTKFELKTEYSFCLWWTLGKSFTRKYMRHPGRLRRFPSEIIGWRNWVQKLLDKQKSTNQPNERHQIQWLEQDDLLRQNYVQKIDKRFLLGCESTKMSVERSDKDKDAEENVDADQISTGGTCEKWTIHRFVHTARGNRHWLLSVWIATCSCETSRKLPYSRTREEDRESPSSTITSSRSATKWCLQPI